MSSEPSERVRVGPPALPPALPSFTTQEMADLRRAKELLENPGLSARIAGVIGRPLEEGLKLLPAGWQKTVARATQLALDKALAVAISSLGRRPTRKSS